MLRNDSPTLDEPAAGTVAPSAVDQIVLAMRKLISDEHLKVGDRLPTERDLCERFTASRNTVREAMRMLKAYGIVEVRPKVGATLVDNRMHSALDLFSFNVNEISRKSFADIQGFRELIEIGSAMPIFAAVQQTDVDDLRRINAEMARSKSVIEASELDFGFHTRLVSIVDNKAILDVYQIMKPILLRIMQRGKTRRQFQGETSGEHGRIIDAIDARDALAYQYLMRTHLRAGLVNF
jgi:GntR family transcriptional regulator, transcriptional repressor for pyruvate dehydrogenase complex